MQTFCQKLPFHINQYIAQHDGWPKKCKASSSMHRYVYVDVVFHMCQFFKRSMKSFLHTSQVGHRPVIAYWEAQACIRWMSFLLISGHSNVVTESQFQNLQPSLFCRATLKLHHHCLDLHYCTNVYGVKLFNNLNVILFFVSTGYLQQIEGKHPVVFTTSSKKRV